MNLNAKTALITGASQGLGRALAFELSRRGASVVLVARGRTQLDHAVQEVRAEGGSAYGIVADVASKQDIYRISGEASAQAGPIDVAILNASTLGPLPLPELIALACEDLAEVFELNVMGHFRLAKALVGPMLLRGEGTVLALSSDAAVSAYPTWGAYGASKAAFDHLLRVWAEELTSSGVRLLSVDPGEMDTQMHKDAMPDADPTSLNRPEAVAKRIASMLEDTARATNGDRLAADQWRASA